MRDRRRRCTSTPTEPDYRRAEQQGGEVDRASPAVRSPDVLSTHNDICSVRLTRWGEEMMRRAGNSVRHAIYSCGRTSRKAPPEAPHARCDGAAPRGSD